MKEKPEQSGATAENLIKHRDAQHQNQKCEEKNQDAPKENLAREYPRIGDEGPRWTAPAARPPETLLPQNITNRRNL